MVAHVESIASSKRSRDTHKMAACRKAAEAPLARLASAKCKNRRPLADVLPFSGFFRQDHEHAFRCWKATLPVVAPSISFPLSHS